MDSLKELYAYREMLLNLVKKDLRTRYKGSFLGFLWTFINPLLQLLIYSLVFSVIMRVNVEKYYIFLFVALIPWLFFTSSVQAGVKCIITNSNLVKKIYFPRIVLPIAITTSSLINMFFCFIIVFGALITSGIGVSSKIIYLPLIIIIEYIFTLALTILLSAANVYFRDLEHILNIIIMAWFYLTPIVYTIDMVPEKYLFLYYLNPMTSIIVGYRDILYYHSTPNFIQLLFLGLISCIFMFFSYRIFQKLQKGFVEEI